MSGIRSAERSLRKSELEQIVDISGECYDLPHNRTELRDFLRRDDGMCYVAQPRDSSQVEGYLFFTICIDHIEVHDIAVEAQARRQGVGTSLVQQLLDSSKGFKSAIVCRVLETNLTGLNFFKSQGFRGRLDRKIGIDDIIMERRTN